MAKSKIQFQKGYSLVDFMRDYGTEAQCEEALFHLRWPHGFICPACGQAKYCQLAHRGLLQCNGCHTQTSLTAGTIFASTKLPLVTWFLAIHLVTQSKTAISALELKRQVGVSYNTAWSMKQKIMQVMMDRDNKQPLSGWIQLDDVYWGGRKPGGKRGRGSENKTPFVAAVEVNKEGHPIRMSMQVVKGFRESEIIRWAKHKLTPGSMVVSDGLACFGAVVHAGCDHNKVITGGGPDSVKHPEFLWVNTMIGNVKTAIQGTFHHISAKHLQRYLAEFCYRFNRRFDLAVMLQRFTSAALQTPPMPYRLLTLAEFRG